MKRKIALVLLVFAFHAGAKAQKPLVCLETIKNWQECEQADLTLDGRYGMYIVTSQKKMNL